MSELYANTFLYCGTIILYEECKWWQFTRKKIIRDELNYLYPLMKNEMKNKDTIQNHSFYHFLSIKSECSDN